MTESRPGGRTGRPALTDRATLVRVAHDLGFDNLTVGAVTGQAGIKYSTFYRHFASLDELIAELVDEVLAEMPPLPALPCWQDVMTHTSDLLVDVMSRHPGLATRLLSMPTMPPRLLECYVTVTEAMHAAGFGAHDIAVGASMTIELSITPWLTLSEGDWSQNRRSQTHDALGRVDPAVLAVAREAVDSPPDLFVDMKLALLVDGLAARLRTPRADDVPTSRRSSN